MATATKICKICGKEYEYCKTIKSDPNQFRWQDVACSPKHGQEYLKKIIESRSMDTKETHKPVKGKVSKESTKNTTSTTTA